MKKIIIFILLTFISCTKVYASSKLLVVTENYPPFQSLNSEGKLVGVAAEIVNKVLTHSQLEYEIQVMPWARAYQSAKTSPNTLIFSLLQTPSRKELFQWLVPLCKVTTSFYTLTSRIDVNASSLKEIASYRIGIAREQATKFFLESNNLMKNAIEVNDNQQLRKMIQHNRIDLMLSSDNYVKALQKDNDLAINDLKLLFTVDELNQTLYLAANQHVPAEITSKIIQSYQELSIEQLAVCRYDS